jgi:hypothetical protein
MGQNLLSDYIQRLEILLESMKMVLKRRTLGDRKSCSLLKEHLAIRILWYCIIRPASYLMCLNILKPFHIFFEQLKLLKTWVYQTTCEISPGLPLTASDSRLEAVQHK